MTSPIEPVDIASAYQVVTERIRHAQIGVSRTTIREAIRVLEAEGYLVSKRGANGGITVLDQSKDEKRLRPLLAQRMPELEQAFEYRIAVEGDAAYFAALRRSKSDLQKLRKAFKVLSGGRETARFRAADSDFHLTIAAAAQNSFMREAIENVRAYTWMPIDRLVVGVFETANDLHALILEAIESQDAVAAKAAAIAHIEAARNDLRRVLSQS